MGFLAASQNAGRAGLDSERGCVGSYIWTAFIDNGDDAHRDENFGNFDAVRAYVCRQNFADRVGQSGDLTDPIRHSPDPFFAEGEPVQHDIGDDAALGFHIFRVRSKDRGGILFEGLRHEHKGVILCFGSGSCQSRPRASRASH